MSLIKRIFQSKLVKIGLFGLALAASSVSAKTGIVTAKGLQIRAGPSETTTSLGSISNTKVKILDTIHENGDTWHKILVQTHDGTKTQAYIAGEVGGEEYVQVDDTTQKVNLTPDFDISTPSLQEYATFVSQWEGFKSKAYVCEKDNLEEDPSIPPDIVDKRFRTIGFGTLLSNDPVLLKRLKHLGLDKISLIREKQQVTNPQAMYLLIEEVKGAEKRARVFAPNFDSLPKELKLIMVDMAYNLAPQRYFGFTNLRKAVANHDYQQAALEMKFKNGKGGAPTPWYNQVGQRSKHHVHVTYDLAKVLLASNKDIPRTNI